MADPTIRVLTVELEDDCGIIVTFSDGTCDGYAVEELLDLRPHRPLTNCNGAVGMASKLSDREYLIRLLDKMEGKTNHMKAKRIAHLFGGRIRQRVSASKRILANPGNVTYAMQSSLPTENSVAGL